MQATVVGSRTEVTLDDGSRVMVADSGPATRQVGVVAVPGWKGADLGLRELVARTALRGLRTVTLNLPGMGVSASTGQVTEGLDELCVLVEQVVSTVSPGAPVVLVGHSFGATIATAVAGRRRADLRGLVLVSPVVVAPRDRAGLGARFGNACASAFAAVLGHAPATVAGAVVRSTLLEDVGNAFLARHGVRGFLRIRAEAAPERRLAADPRVAADHLRLAARYGCLDLAADVGVPTWVVAGDGDQLSPPGDLARLQRALPSARVSLLPGGGHLAHQEDAPEFGDLVATCVADLASS